jgi:hypothetical protein
MGQQCGCFSDSAPRKLMHGTRVSAGKEKGHAPAFFLVHEIPGIGMGDCRIALPSRAVAEEIALNAFPNSSFFGGTYQELKRARFFSERKPSPSNPDGLTR